MLVKSKAIEKAQLKVLAHRLLAIVIAAAVTAIIGIAGKTAQDKGYFEEDDGVLPDFSGEYDTYVRFIDVGQGDSALICSDGHYMLIDTGDRDSSNDVINLLDSEGVKRLDYLVLSHPHSDHIGEAAEIIEHFGIDCIIVPEVPDDLIPTSVTYEKLLDAMDVKGYKFHVAKEETFELGTCSFDTWAAQGDYSNINNYSVVVKLNHGENSFLFCGDGEEEEEDELLASGMDIQADVLKAPHHGSDTSSTSNFLSAVKPKYTVISCGVDNSYGHPDEETLRRIMKYSPYVYVTATDGGVTFESDGKNLKCTAESKDPDKGEDNG